ncbi:unnamed protein product, partial [Bubo scandiacus]
IRIAIGAHSDTWSFFQRGMRDAEVWGSHPKVKREHGHNAYTKPMLSWTSENLLQHHRETLQGPRGNSLQVCKQLILPLSATGR